MSVTIIPAETTLSQAVSAARRRCGDGTAHSAPDQLPAKRLKSFGLSSRPWKSQGLHQPAEHFLGSDNTTTAVQAYLRIVGSAQNTAASTASRDRNRLRNSTV